MTNSCSDIKVFGHGQSCLWLLLRAFYASSKLTHAKTPNIDDIPHDIPVDIPESKPNMLQRPSYNVVKPLYGQLVVGPPGSGKTTYCRNAEKFFKELGRKVAIVNLDPANENMDYTPAVDISDLITVNDVMEQLNLGPNGALMYCADYLVVHIHDWLLKEMRRCAEQYDYILFDCPGQVELYTHHAALARVFESLQKDGYNLVTVNLIDSHYCSDPGKFVSTLILALNMMLRLGLPHVNVLSKADLMRQNASKLHFNVDFYTDVLDLKYLLEALDETPAMERYRKLNACICSVVEDYGLVSFVLLDSYSTSSMLRLRNHVDKANGYVYRAGEEQSVNSMMASAVGAESETKRQAEDVNPYVP